MTATVRRVAPLVLALLVGACASTGSPSPSASPRPLRPSPTARLTAVPGGRSPSPSPTLPATTVTEWGTIWDAVPASFPRLSHSTVGEDPDPASAEFVELVGDPSTASASIRRQLTDQGWTVDAGSPLEDGSVVLDATGPVAGCVAQIRFTAVAGSVIMKVLYGAACPFP